MKSYGKSIEETLNKTFQVMMQGYLNMSDFKNMLNSCSKEYNYEIKNYDNKYYLILSKGNIEVRIPENENEYLKIN
jgi:hypothetical protein